MRFYFLCFFLSLTDGAGGDWCGRSSCVSPEAVHPWRSRDLEYLLSPSTGIHSLQDEWMAFSGDDLANQRDNRETFGGGERRLVTDPA
ncbi:hypothetical protein LZ31DRAFT_526080 [Colletotrichum somersetense]|nr:hypothetical protein LZ31DRAFT_526080 [Colletotrichum somersetense]